MCQAGARVQTYSLSKVGVTIWAGRGLSQKLKRRIECQRPVKREEQAAPNFGIQTSNCSEMRFSIWTQFASNFLGCPSSCEWCHRCPFQLRQVLFQSLTSVIYFLGLWPQSAMCKASPLKPRPMFLQQRLGFFSDLGDASASKRLRMYIQRLAESLLFLRPGGGFFTGSWQQTGRWKVIRRRQGMRIPFHRVFLAPPAGQG